MQFLLLRFFFFFCLFIIALYHLSLYQGLGRFYGPHIKTRTQLEDLLWRVDCRDLFRRQKMDTWDWKTKSVPWNNSPLEKNEHGTSWPEVNDVANHQATGLLLRLIFVSNPKEFYRFKILMLLFCHLSWCFDSNCSVNYQIGTETLPEYRTSIQTIMPNWSRAEMCDSEVSKLTFRCWETTYGYSL